MNQIKVLLITLGILNPNFSAWSQQPNAAAILGKTDSAIASLTHHSYQVHFRFKSAPKTDTSRREASVLLFSAGSMQNDTLKSYVILYPDSSRIESFDGRYFYEVNHKLKTIRTTDIALQGYKKAVSGWAGDFAYLPLLRKSAQHFLPGIYRNSKVVDMPAPNKLFYSIEHVDSTLNDWKIAAFDPDYITTKTVFEIDASTFYLRKITRWITFMATPQYDETLFAEVASLPDTATFASFFNLDNYIREGYIDYETYKASKKEQRPALKVKTHDVFPAFHLSNTNLHTVHSDSLNTGLLLIDFWYRSCYPCLKAMPVLENLHQKYKDKGLLVIGINARDTSVVEVGDFMKARQVNYLALMDSNGTFAKELTITGFPTIFLVDAASKKILFYQNGYSDKMEVLLETMISERLTKGE